MSKRKMLCFSVAAMAVLAGQAQASSTGKRQIVAIACHNDANICIARLSGAAFGPPACQSTEVRWNEKNDPGGHSSLSLLTAAFLAGKTVEFSIRDDKCFTEQPLYPTFQLTWVY